MIALVSLLVLPCIAVARDTSPSLSAQEIQNLLKEWQLDHVFEKAFAEKQYDGYMLLGAEKHDIDEEFAHVSPLHRRALWNHIEELKTQQQDLTSSRMLSAIDFSSYQGVQIERKSAWLTFGEDADIKFYRTASGELKIRAPKGADFLVDGAAGITINGKAISASGLSSRVEKIEKMLASVCGNGKKEFGELCDDGNTKSGDGCKASCKEVEAGFKCKDGKCEDADGCEGVGCGVGAECKDIPAPGTGFQCKCKDGFRGETTTNIPAKCESPCEGNGPVWVKNAQHFKGANGGGAASNSALKNYPGGNIAVGGNGGQNGGHGHVVVTVKSGYKKSFSFSGSIQTWTVPKDVTEATFTLWGGAGGGDYSNLKGGGGGGSVGLVAGLTPGSNLYILVGGGGSKGVCPGSGGGGGGLSGVFLSADYTQANAIIIAGGGSGAADGAVGAGGGGTMANGGVAAGGSRQGQGSGGTQTMGGGVAAAAICKDTNPYNNKNLVDPTAGSALRGGNGGMEGEQCGAGSNNWFDGVKGWSKGGYGGGGWGGAEPGGSMAGSGGGGGYFGGGGGGTYAKNGCMDGSGGGGSSYALLSKGHAHTLQCDDVPEHLTKGYKMYRIDVTAVNQAYWCLEEMYFYNEAGRIKTKPEKASAQTAYCTTGGVPKGTTLKDGVTSTCGPSGTHYMPGIAFNEESQQNKYYYCSRKGVPKGWLAYTFDEPTKLTAYGIRTLDLKANGVYSPLNWMFEASNDGKKWTTLHSHSGVSGWKDGTLMTFKLTSGVQKDDGIQHYYFDTPPGKKNGYMCNDVGSATVWSQLDPSHTFPQSAAVTDMGFYTVYAFKRGCTVRTCTNKDCSANLGDSADFYYEAGNPGGTCNFSPNYSVQDRKSTELKRSSTWTVKAVANKKKVAHCPRVSLARFSGRNLCDYSGRSAVCGPAAAAAGCVNKDNLQLPYSIVTGSPGTSNSYHTCPQPTSPLHQKPQYFYFDNAGTGMQCKDQGSIGGVINPGFEKAVDGSKLAGHFSPDAAVLSVALYTVYGASGRGCKLSMCTDPKCSAGHQFRLQFEHRTDTGCDFSKELKVQEYGHVRSTSWVLHSRGSTLHHCPRISVVRYRGFNLCPPGVEACGPAVKYHKCVNPFTQKLINALRTNDGDATSSQTCKDVPDWTKVPQKFSYSTNWNGAKAFCEGKGMRLPCAIELCSSPDNFAPGVAACDGRGGLPSGGRTTDKWTPVMDKVKGGYGEYLGCSRDLFNIPGDRRGCEIHAAHAGGNIPTWGAKTNQRWQGWVYCIGKNIKQPC